MILLVAEQRGGRLHRASWELVVAAQTMAEPEAIEALLLGSKLQAATSEFAKAGIAAVHTADSPLLEPYTADAYSAVIQEAVARLQPSHVLFAHSYRTRDFAPMLAARIDCGLVTDCIGVTRGDTFTFTRPVYQGKLAAEVRIEGGAPHLVSIQIGVYRADDAVRGSTDAPIRELPFNLDPSTIRQRPEEPFQEAAQSVDLSQADRIVAVGRGIKAQEHIGLAEKLAAALGAQIAASRPICDSGWLPMERQIGSSGQTVSPKLYVALGISGAIQHVVGMKGSRTIVAINKDPDAPIFEIADYGIAGDLFEIVPALIAELEKA